MLTFPQRDRVTVKHIESLLNKKQKRKIECDLVNIFAICRVEGIK